MAVIPAGTLPDGTPLTAMEASVLVGINKWSDENLEWFRKRKFFMNIRIGFMLCLGLGFLHPSLFFIFILLLLSVSYTLKNHTPGNLSLPMIGVSSHNLVNWNGKNFFITKNVRLSTNLDVYGDIPSRNPHVFADIQASSEWVRGDSEYHQLSIDTFNSFIENESLNVENLNAMNFHNIQLPILEFGSASLLENLLIGDFSSHHFGEDVSGFASVVDTLETTNALEKLDWIQVVYEYNEELSQKQVQNIDDERLPYLSWTSHVKDRCSKLSDIAFDSNLQGWNQSKLGLDASEQSLENSVASDVIAQEESVKRELEKSEAKLREKKADFELQNMELNIDLNRKLSELDGMIDVSQSVIKRLKYLDVPEQLVLQTSYGVTTGGGGRLMASGGVISAVDTKVKTDYYSIDNPASKTIEGLKVLAVGDLNQYMDQKTAIINRISELDGSFQIRIDRMKEQQNLRLKEIESAKERAVRAIKKDSIEVRSIELLGGSQSDNPFQSLKKLNRNLWIRPYTILSSLLSKYDSISDQFKSAQNNISSHNESVMRFLLHNNTTQFNEQYFHHHWLVLPSGLYSEIICVGSVDFDGISNIQIEVGASLDLLGLHHEDVRPVDINTQNLESAIFSLYKRGVLSDSIMNSIIKFKKNILRDL
jgi:hypothetical protein